SPSWVVGDPLGAGHRVAGAPVGAVWACADPGAGQSLQASPTSSASHWSLGTLRITADEPSSGATLTDQDSGMVLVSEVMSKRVRRLRSLSKTLLRGRLSPRVRVIVRSGLWIFSATWPVTLRRLRRDLKATKPMAPTTMAMMRMVMM